MDAGDEISDVRVKSCFCQLFRFSVSLLQRKGILPETWGKEVRKVNGERHAAQDGFACKES